MGALTPAQLSRLPTTNPARCEHHDGGDGGNDDGDDDGDKKPHKCGQCNYSTTPAKIMNCYLITHSGVRMHKSNECNKKECKRKN